MDLIKFSLELFWLLSPVSQHIPFLSCNEHRQRGDVSSWQIIHTTWSSFDSWHFRCLWNDRGLRAKLWVCPNIHSMGISGKNTDENVLCVEKTKINFHYKTEKPKKKYPFQFLKSKFFWCVETCSSEVFCQSLQTWNQCHLCDPLPRTCEKIQPPFLETSKIITQLSNVYSTTIYLGDCLLTSVLE